MYIIKRMKGRIIFEKKNIYQKMESHFIGIILMHRFFHKCSFFLNISLIIALKKKKINCK